MRGDKLDGSPSGMVGNALLVQPKRSSCRYSRVDDAMEQPQ